MRILVIESGGASAVIAAVEIEGLEAQVCAYGAITEPRALARDLIPTLHGVLQEAAWDVKELDLVAASLGPGSWTSLRVGLTTAKTLAQAHSLPLAGVATFDAIAAAAHSHRLQGASAAPGKNKRRREAVPPAAMLLVLAPCRPGELYGKLYLSHADYLGIAQAEWIAPAKSHLDAAFSQMLASEIEGPLLVAGDGYAEAVRLLEEQEDAFNFIAVTNEEVALELAIAGAAKTSEGDTDDFLSLVPLYLAASNAERNLAAGTLKAL